MTVSSILEKFRTKRFWLDRGVVTAFDQLDCGNVRKTSPRISNVPARLGSVISEIGEYSLTAILDCSVDITEGLAHLRTEDAKYEP
jgi:hypothetical protein